MGMMLEPSIDDELDDRFAEREDTHVMLSDEMKAVVARANASRHLQRKWMVSRSLPKIFITRERYVLYDIDVSNFHPHSLLTQVPLPQNFLLSFHK